jgi:exopolysaccharide biosynthesis protein
MKKANAIILFSLLTLILIYTGIPASAQEVPCIAAPYGWQYQDDTRSIVINKVSENKITYYIADVQLTDAAGFRTSSTGNLLPVSELASQANAILAINGDDFGTHKYGVIIRNGKLLRTHDTTRNLLVVDAQGDMSVKVDRKNEDYKSLGRQLINDGALQTFEFGPELTRDGQLVAFSSSFDVISTSASRLEPRTAIGQIGPLHYILIVVDGRQDGYSVGISLQDLQQLFIRYGAKTAMNLDGGGSSEMWFQGEILNQPSGGQERYVSDIIYF